MHLLLPSKVKYATLWSSELNFLAGVLHCFSISGKVGHVRIKLNQRGLNMKVLILEDDPMRIRKFKSFYPGCVVVSHANECIQQLKSDSWDLISLDHDLNWQMFVDPSDADCGMEVVRFMASDKVPVKSVILHSANKEAVKLMHDGLASAGYNVAIEPFNPSNV